MKRVYLRRVWDDGTVEEFDCPIIDGNQVDVSDVPPANTSVAGRSYADEVIVEWEHGDMQVIAQTPEGFIEMAEELRERWREEADELLDREPYYDMEGNRIGWREWAETLQDIQRRIVKQDYVGHYFVSTVLLGHDHGFDPTKPPIIFETMIFDQSSIAPKDRKASTGEDVFCDRYTNKDAALAGHDQAVERARREDFEY